MNGPERAKVGYLVHAEDDAAMVALGDLLQHRYRVHVFDQPTALGGVKFAKGTLLMRTGENPESLHEAVRRVALEYGLSVLATDTGLVDEGAGLGGAARELGQAAQGRDDRRPACVAVFGPHLVPV